MKLYATDWLGSVQSMITLEKELKKKKKVGELDDTELDGISGGEGMDTGKIIP